MKLAMTVVLGMLDEVVISVVLFWLLPKLGIVLASPIAVLIIVLLIASAVVTSWLLVRTLSLRPLAGMSSMVGLRARTIGSLSPDGMVAFHGELWQAKSVEEEIGPGVEVIVLTQEGLKLFVRRASPDECVRSA